MLHLLVFLFLNVRNNKKQKQKVCYVKASRLSSTLTFLTVLRQRSGITPGLHRRWKAGRVCAISYLFFCFRVRIRARQLQRDRVIAYRRGRLYDSLPEHDPHLSGFRFCFGGTYPAYTCCTDDVSCANDVLYVPLM